MSAERPMGSGFGTVSTWISSRGLWTLDSLALPLACAGIDIILHVVQRGSMLWVISTSLHRSRALIVAKIPSGLCNLAWRSPVSIFTFLFIEPVEFQETGEVPNSFGFWFLLCSATNAFDCNEVIKIIILSPSFIPNLIVFLEKCTQLWPFVKKTFTEIDFCQDLRLSEHLPKLKNQVNYCFC